MIRKEMCNIWELEMINIENMIKSIGEKQTIHLDLSGFTAFHWFIDQLAVQTIRFFLNSFWRLKTEHVWNKKWGHG